MEPPGWNYAWDICGFCTENPDVVVEKQFEEEFGADRF